MKAMTPTLHMSVARLKGSKLTTSGAVQYNKTNTGDYRETTLTQSTHTLTPMSTPQYNQTLQVSQPTAYTEPKRTQVFLHSLSYSVLSTRYNS